MSVTRQVIGKRRKVSAVQARGVERREALVKAATELMAQKPMEVISFRDIAQKAKVPESSAYHFYANKYDLFSAVASEMLSLFYEAYTVPIPDEEVRNWEDVIDTIIDRAIEIFRSNVVARELLVGPKTPPEIKPDDPSIDKLVFSAITERFEDHFILPDIPDFESKLKFASILFDSLLTAGLRESGEISNAIVQEAKRACRGYLSSYLPPVLEKQKVLSELWETFPL